MGRIFTFDVDHPEMAPEQLLEHMRAGDEVGLQYINTERKRVELFREIMEEQNG